MHNFSFRQIASTALLLLMLAAVSPIISYAAPIKPAGETKNVSFTVESGDPETISTLRKLLDSRKVSYTNSTIEGRGGATRWAVSVPDIDLNEGGEKDAMTKFLIKIIQEGEAGFSLHATEARSVSATSH